MVQVARPVVLPNEKCVCARVRFSSAALFRPWVVGPCELRTVIDVRAEGNAPEVATEIGGFEADVRIPFAR